MLAETTDNTNCHCHTLLWRLRHWFSKPKTQSRRTHKHSPHPLDFENANTYSPWYTSHQ